MHQFYGEDEEEEVEEVGGEGVKSDGVYTDVKCA